jgi:hypothetical protein
MSVRPDKEALFNEVYDKEHVPALLGAPGVIAVARFKSEPVRAGQRGMGKGGGGRALGRTRASVHDEPPPRDVPPHRVASVRVG